MGSRFSLRKEIHLADHVIPLAAMLINCRALEQILHKHLRYMTFGDINNQKLYGVT